MTIVADDLDPVFDVDARAIAKGLGVEARDVPTMMRNGDITSRSERGEGEDAGRYRLTFFHESVRCHLIVDEVGTILQTSWDRDG